PDGNWVDSKGRTQTLPLAPQVPIVDRGQDLVLNVDGYLDAAGTEPVARATGSISNDTLRTGTSVAVSEAVSSSVTAINSGEVVLTFPASVASATGPATTFAAIDSRGNAVTFVVPA